MATTTVFGVPHHYSLTADTAAAPIVFIHGWLLSHKYWQPIIAELALSHPCLAYDLRGFGASRHQLHQFQPGLPPRAQALDTSPIALWISRLCQGSSCTVRATQPEASLAGRAFPGGWYCPLDSLLLPRPD
jgi:pimeloyl-ACP methyl ester carboxylesterase